MQGDAGAPSGLPRAGEAPALERPTPGEPAPPPGDAPAAPRDEPWRLGRALDLPPWLHVEGEHRARAERVWRQYRSGRPGDDRALFLRTLVRLELRLEEVLAPVDLGVEVQDARAYRLGDGEVPLGDTEVDAVEVLEAYARLRLDRWLPAGAKGHVRAGRFTLDLGSRRVLARNRYRNTINAFTGAEARWESPGGWAVQALAGVPVRRLPNDVEGLEDNEVRRDRENERVVLAGLHLATPALGAAKLLGEAYVLGLHERDRPDVQTLDRRLVTAGLRFGRKPETGTVDFELEALLQLGASRRTAGRADRRDLQHRAWAAHARVGYRHDGPGQPRLALVLDYASGDRDPGDRRQGRFDPLFGARRFELGPTGLWGLVPRSNLLGPGARFELQPHATVKAFAAYRAFLLAERRDAWTTARVVDPTGRAGRLVGHHVEGAIAWAALPGSVELELGAAALFRGDYAREAPGTTPGDPLYGYAQLTLWF